MDRTRRVGFAVGGAMLATLVCSACAVSSYDDNFEELDADLSPVSGFDASVRADSGSAAPSYEAATPWPPYVPPDGSGTAAPQIDASTPNPVRDAGASTPRDAGSTVRDASATPTPTPTPTPRPDAGAPASGTCSQDSDCKQECVPVGLFTCCDENKRCGCTWVPGAYCS